MKKLDLKKEPATKYDIKELERKIEETKAEILKWFIGLFISLVISYRVELDPFKACRK